MYSTIHNNITVQHADIDAVYEYVKKRTNVQIYKDNILVGIM